MRTDLREASLGRVREAVEHRTSDRELEHAVAEELEPLVRRRSVLGPGRVSKYLLEPYSRQLGDETAELAGPRLVNASPGAR